MNLSGEWLNTGLKDGKALFRAHIELTYDLAQRTLTTVETGAKPPFRRWNEQQQIIGIH